MYYELTDHPHPPLYVSEEAMVLKWAFEKGVKGEMQDCAQVRKHNALQMPYWCWAGLRAERKAVRMVSTAGGMFR